MLGVLVFEFMHATQYLALTFVVSWVDARMQDWIGSFRSVLPSQSRFADMVAPCSVRPYPMQIYAKVLRHAKSLGISRT